MSNKSGANIAIEGVSGSNGSRPMICCTLLRQSTDVMQSADLLHTYSLQLPPVSERFGRRGGTGGGTPHTGRARTVNRLRLPHISPSAARSLV